MSGPAPVTGASDDWIAIYRRLLRYVRPHWPIALVAMIGMVGEALMAGAFTALMRPMVDGTFIERDPVMLRWLPFAIVAIFLVRGISGFLADVGSARVGRSVVVTLRTELLSKYLRLPSSWFDRESTATMVSRLNYNAEQVAHAASDAIKIMMTEALTIVVLLGVMFYQSAKLTLTVAVMVPVIAVIVALVGRRYRRINENIQQAYGALAHASEEALAGHEAVKIFGGSEQEIKRYTALARNNFRLNLKVVATQAVSSGVVQVLAAIALATIVYVAGRAAVSDGMTAGMFMSHIGAMMAMLPSIKRVTNVQTVTQRGIAAASSLFEVFDEPEEVDSGQLAPQRVRGEIRFESVSFRYAADKPQVLHNVSIDVPAGSLTAIVGRSGSGKSTLLRLLPRFYEPMAGRILLDGAALTDYRLQSLRQQIAVVSQNVVLFDDTIARNIAYGALSAATPAEIEAAATAANAMEFINLLPQGMESRIGDRGVLLSGGQRQRLAIARAILKNAPVLILDEATSALDTESERLIQQALDRILVGRTALVIAHRLSTIEHADQVVVLEAGRVAETGRHADMITRGGVYAQLHGLQFREIENA
ncbi:MAG: lipid A export permease/ATP-binding protein MsbA [Pseudomonadota bacterium]|nr:lipid A export permease/ATP-binding protein MsbA [Pseudomonadota bacterium]